jgi:hypothetical protein
MPEKDPQMKTKSITVAQDKRWLVSVEGGTVIGHHIEMWAVVTFEGSEEEHIVPVIMAGTGPLPITDPIGTPGSKYLGISTRYPIDEREFEERRKRYLSQSGPS